MAALAEAALSKAERETVERFVASLRDRFGPELCSVWLYGSRARGEIAHQESDIDLLVVTEGGRQRDFRVVSDLLHDAAQKAGAEPAFFSSVVMSPERVRDRRRIHSFFIQEVDRDKIILHGEP